MTDVVPYGEWQARNPATRRASASACVNIGVHLRERLEEVVVDEDRDITGLVRAILREWLGKQNGHAQR
jgi:hypothetical protein